MINYNIDIDKITAVAIVFWGRSGSVFMSTLLDNHKNILSIPDCNMTTFFDLTGFWLKHESCKDEKKLIELFCQEYNGIFNHEVHSCDENIPNEYVRIDIDIFKQHITNFAKHNSLLIRKNFFIFIHFAYELSLGRDISEKYIINFNLHDTKPFTRVRDFLEDFPNAKFLGMQREPIRALYSHMRHHKDNVLINLEVKNYDEIQRLYGWRKNPNKPIFDYIKETYDFSYEVLDGTLDRYYEHQVIGWKRRAVEFKMDLLPVQLEKLHDEPQASMQRIADFLNIDFDNTLLESTVGGLKYWGDPRIVSRINGFSSEHTRKSSYKDCFSDLDVYILNNVVARIHTEYDYLMDKSLSLAKLLELIKMPTKLEYETINNTYGTDIFDEVYSMYVKRINFLHETLHENKENFVLISKH